MPQFEPGIEKTAIVPMANPTGKTFAYDAAIYMGVNMVVMAMASFALESGEEKEISLPVTMPAEPGTYPVYLDIWSGSELLGHYRVTEDVVILPAGGALGDFIYTNISCRAPQKPDSSWHYLEFDALITNLSDRRLTREIRLWEYDQGRGAWWNVTLSSGLKYEMVTLEPGQSYQFHHSDSNVARNCTVRMYLIDSVGDKSATCTCYS